MSRVICFSIRLIICLGVPKHRMSHLVGHTFGVQNSSQQNIFFSQFFLCSTFEVIFWQLLHSSTASHRCNWGHFKLMHPNAILFFRFQIFCFRDSSIQFKATIECNKSIRYLHAMCKLVFFLFIWQIRHRTQRKKYWGNVFYQFMCCFELLTT